MKIRILYFFKEQIVKVYEIFVDFFYRSWQEYLFIWSFREWFEICTLKYTFLCFNDGLAWRYVSKVCIKPSQRRLLAISQLWSCFNNSAQFCSLWQKSTLKVFNFWLTTFVIIYIKLTTLFQFDDLFDPI